VPRAATADAGDVIGGYELLREIGRGGMAEVWVARRSNSTSSKFVAMKLILAQYAGDERYSRMFRSEAETAAPLSHSNIVQVFDEGEDNGRSYMVMEWVDGVDLARLAPDIEAMVERDDELRLRVIAYVVGQVLHGLSYAHRVTNARGDAIGIVHRDVSPQNVLVSVSGDVKLTDFGIAHRMIEETSGIHVKGKLRYMPPEQLVGQSKAPTVDLFAVGAILHELLDGKKFRHHAEDQMQLYHSVLSGEMPALGRPAPPELEAVRVALLQSDPKKRVQTADAAILMLKKWPGYSEMKVELGQVCGLMTGIVRPRTGPRFTGDVAERGKPVSTAPVSTSPSTAGLGHAESGALTRREPDAPSFLHRAADAEPAGTAVLGDVEMASMRDRAKSDPTVMLPDSAESAAVPQSAYKPAFAGPDESTATSTAAGRAERSPTLANAEESSQVGIERAESFVEPRRRFGAIVAVAATFAVVVGGGVGYLVLESFDDPAVRDPPSPASISKLDRTHKPAAKEDDEPGPILTPVTPKVEPADVKATAAAAAPTQPPAVPTEPIADPTPSGDSAAKPASSTPKETKPKSDPKPKPAPGIPVTVHLRVDKKLGTAYLMIGKQQYTVMPRYDAKIASGRHSVKWRLDPADAWKSGGTIDLVAGGEFVVQVGESGVSLKKM
jgi:serine/threonine protein kinase